MNYKPEKIVRRKYAMTQRAWAEVIFWNIIIYGVLVFVFHGAGSSSPFQYALILSVGIFLLSAIIVSNVKRSKPWSRFRWE